MRAIEMNCENHEEKAESLKARQPLPYSQNSSLKNCRYKKAQTDVWATEE